MRVPLLFASAALALCLVPRPVAGGGATLVSIQAYPDRASIFPGGAFGFGAIGHYSDGSTRILTRKASFQSSNLSVAEFVKKNTILGVTAGTVTITASVSGVISQPLQFGVSPLAALTILPDVDGIRLGSLVRYGANGTLEDGFDGLPVSELVEWISLAPAVLPIGSGRKDRGLAEALALGTAPIQAQLGTSGPSITRDIHVVGMLAAVRVSPAQRVLRVGEGGRFRTIGSFEGGVEAEITPDVDWFSEHEDVVSVGSRGSLKVRGFGTATLRVVDRETGIDSQASGGNAQLTIVGPLRTLAVAPAALALLVGEEERFDVNGTVELDEAGTNLGSFDWAGRVDWFSSDSAVASVDDEGDVRCESAGTATVSARVTRSGILSSASDADGEITCS
jgi:hypothetical protein